MMIIYPENVKKIAKILADAGHSAYAVGGCMRDSVMGKAPNDWDMTTSAHPEEMLKIFDAAGIRTIPTGLKHGTVTVLLDGEAFECTTFRIDGSYTDSRHPDSVTFTPNVAEDLKRRDFTVNAMAGNPLCDNDVVDLFGGKDDIKNKVIRCVGDPETRFSEDALRILRAVRFATTLDFFIDGDTKKAARTMSDGLLSVSIERKVVELKKILLSDNADRGISLLFELGLQKYIHKDLTLPCVALNTLPKSFTIRTAALFGIDKAPELSSLKLSRQEEKEIKLLCGGKYNEPTPVGARYLIAALGNCAEGAALLRGDVQFARLIADERAKDPCVSISYLPVNGNDLISLGIPPREIGDIMQRLLDAVIKDPSLCKNDVLLHLAKTIYNEKRS